MIGALLGILCGALFGFVLQRGRVCFSSAFSDLYLSKDNYIIKAGLLAIALTAIGFMLLAQFGLIKLAPSALNWGGVSVGGYLFGVGMVLAGGCAGGMTSRIGEGSTTHIVAGLVYGLSAWSASSGVLKPLKSWANGMKVIVRNVDPKYFVSDEGTAIGPSLSNMFNINPWIPTLVFAIIILVCLFAVKTTKRDGVNLKWWVIGVALTAVNMLTYFLSAQFAQRQYGLGITAGWINILKTWTSADSGAEAAPTLNFAGGIVIGVISGAFISAMIRKEFKWRVPKSGKDYAYAVIGGMLAGFGANFAGGCSIGHFLTGSSLLSLSSFIASLFFLLGNWTMTRIIYGSPVGDHWSD